MTRKFRWWIAVALVVGALVVLVATRGESGIPFGMTLIAAGFAYDG